MKEMRSSEFISKFMKLLSETIKDKGIDKKNIGSDIQQEIKTNIEEIVFAKPESKKAKTFITHKLSDPCMSGRQDAKLYHGKAFGNAALGFFFGPFGVLANVLSSPKPYKDKTAYLSPNKDMFNDPVYLDCYKEKARWQNVGNAAIGWGFWLLLFLL